MVVPGIESRPGKQQMRRKEGVKHAECKDHRLQSLTAWAAGLLGGWV